MYLDHIKGNVDPQIRVGNRPETSYEDDYAGAGASRGGARTGLSQNPLEYESGAEAESRKKTTSKHTLDSNKPKSGGSSMTGGS